MADQNAWWRHEDATKIFHGESDGQKMMYIFAQNTPEGMEYAIIECSDGDYLDCVFGGVTLLNGVVTKIKGDVSDR